MKDSKFELKILGFSYTTENPTKNTIILTLLILIFATIILYIFCKTIPDGALAAEISRQFGRMRKFMAPK